MEYSSNKYFPYILLSLIFLLTLFVYAPGLSGDFVFDDTFNIRDNKLIHIDEINIENLKTAAFSFGSPLKRPISMLSFAANYYLTGLNPYYFKLTNLFIHLLNGLGLYLLTTLLLKSYFRQSKIEHSPNFTNMLATAIVAVWLLHPLNLTSVLYIVQRMASLSTLFTIFGLVLYVLGRQRIYEGKPGRILVAISVFCFTPLAALSKEIGVLLPAFMFVIELTIFRFRTQTSSDRKFLILLFVSVLAIPIAIFAIYLLINPDWITKLYYRRNFDLTERLLTEARVLWFYLQLVLIPNTHNMGLFHDDFVISKGLLEPASTLLSLVGICALLFASIRLRNRIPFFTFGILFFFVGHSIESTFIGLEPVHEHRNYLPQFGIIFFAIYNLLNPEFLNKTTKFRHIITTSIILAIAAATMIRASYWGNPVQLSLVEAEHHPNSSRAHFELGRIYTSSLAISTEPTARDEYRSKAMEHFYKSYQIGDNNLSGLFGIVTLQSSETGSVDDKYFEELATNINTQPFEANTANLINGLINCVSNDRCAISQEKMGEILQATLDNPTLKGKIRSYVLSHVSGYLFNHVNNYQDAINLMYEATVIHPSGKPARISLIKMLIAVNDLKNAERQLQLLEQNDFLGLNKSVIAELKQNIQAMRLAKNQ